MRMQQDLSGILETEELDKQLSEIHQSINNADGNDTDGGAAADKASEIENRKLELYMKAFYLYKGNFWHHTRAKHG